MQPQVAALLANALGAPPPPPPPPPVQAGGGDVAAMANVIAAAVAAAVQPPHPAAPPPVVGAAAPVVGAAAAPAPVGGGGAAAAPAPGVAGAPQYTRVMMRQFVAGLTGNTAQKRAALKAEIRRVNGGNPAPNGMVELSQLAAHLGSLVNA
jgi:hypothetical protein